MKLTLYNTRTRSKEEFVPMQPGKVGIYTCGPTVYHYAHIGNLRSYIFADLLKRVLQFNKFEVNHIMNITDVGHLTSDADDGDDKMEKGAKREGKSVWEIAQQYTQAFQSDLHELNILDPSQWVKATDHIPEQIAQIKILEEKGHTYTTSDGVYFDTATNPSYADFAKLQLDNLEGGKRVDLGEKKHKTDFALWKLSPQDGAKRAMEWESPWGVGFPGWHIECSAMSMKYLGDHFDIHTGGIDHIPIHHTNEIAQAECALADAEPWVRYWMHGDFLVLGKAEKMAKSDDNFLTLARIGEMGYSPLVYRYFCLTASYRQQLSFNEGALESAKNSYTRLKNITAELLRAETKRSDKVASETTAAKTYIASFHEAINDDLNMPKALAALWDSLRDDTLSAIEKLTLARQMDVVFGLDLLKETEQEIPENILAIAKQREVARSNKDWASSDALRDSLAQKGWHIADAKEGFVLSQKE